MPLVDVLSGGRLVYGVGSGYLAHEFAGYAIDPAEKRDRFDENFRIVTRLLAGERLSFEGRFNKIDKVQLNVLPLQKNVPVYVAVLRREAAYFVGKQGLNLLTVPYASVEYFADIGELVRDYQKGRAESGAPVTENNAAVTLHTHVAETDAKARANAEGAFNLYVATRLYAKKSTYDDAMRNGLHLFGSVETVTDKLVDLHGMGVDHVMALQNFGLMQQALVCESMERLMREVMPRVKSRLGVASEVA